MTWEEIAKQGPAVALLALFLFGFTRGWWYISGPIDQRFADYETRLQQCEERSKQWERRALSGLKISEDAAWVAKERGRK